MDASSDSSQADTFMEQQNAQPVLKSLLPIIVRLVLKQRTRVISQQYDKLLRSIQINDYDTLLMEAKYAKQRLTRMHRDAMLQNSDVDNLITDEEEAAEDRLTSLLVSYAMMSCILRSPITLPSSVGLSHFISLIMLENIGSIDDCFTKIKPPDMLVHRNLPSNSATSKCDIEMAVSLAATAGMLKYLIGHLLQRTNSETGWKDRDTMLRLIASVHSDKIDRQIQTESDGIAIHIQICEGHVNELASILDASLTISDLSVPDWDTAQDQNRTTWGGNIIKRTLKINYSNFRQRIINLFVLESKKKSVTESANCKLLWKISSKEQDLEKCFLERIESIAWHFGLLSKMLSQYSGLTARYVRAILILECFQLVRFNGKHSQVRQNHFAYDKWVQYRDLWQTIDSTDHSFQRHLVYIDKSLGSQEIQRNVLELPCLAHTSSLYTIFRTMRSLGVALWTIWMRKKTAYCLQISSRFERDCDLRMKNAPEASWHSIDRSKWPCLANMNVTTSIEWGPIYPLASKKRRKDILELQLQLFERGLRHDAEKVRTGIAWALPQTLSEVELLKRYDNLCDRVKASLNTFSIPIKEEQYRLEILRKSLQQSLYAHSLSQFSKTLTMDQVRDEIDSLMFCSINVQLQKLVIVTMFPISPPYKFEKEAPAITSTGQCLSSITNMPSCSFSKEDVLSRRALSTSDRLDTSELFMNEFRDLASVIQSRQDLTPTVCDQMKPLSFNTDKDVTQSFNRNGKGDTSSAFRRLHDLVSLYASTSEQATRDLKANRMQVKARKCTRMSALPIHKRIKLLRVKRTDEFKSQKYIHNISHDPLRNPIIEHTQFDTTEKERAQSILFPLRCDEMEGSSDAIALIRGRWMAGVVPDSSRDVPLRPRDFLAHLESILSKSGTISSVQCSKMISENEHRRASELYHPDGTHWETNETQNTDRGEPQFKDRIQEAKNPQDSIIFLLRSDPHPTASSSESCVRDHTAEDMKSDSLRRNYSSCREKVSEAGEQNDNPELLSSLEKTREICDIRPQHEVEEADSLQKRQMFSQNLMRTLIAKHSQILVQQQNDHNDSVTESLKTMYEKIIINRKHLKEVDECAEMIETSLLITLHNKL